MPRVLTMGAVTPFSAPSTKLTIQAPNGLVDPIGLYLLRDGGIDLLPAIRENLEEIPGRSGALDFGSDLGPRGGELHLISPGDLTNVQVEDLKRALAKWVNPSIGAFKLVDELTYADRWLLVKTVGQARLTPYRGGFEATLQLKAVLPFWFSNGALSLTGSGTATVSGNVVTPARVTITGTVTNPSVSIGGRAFSWTGTVGATDTLIIDGDAMTAKFNNSNAISGFSGSWPYLNPGDNVLTAAAAGTTKLEWFDRWI